jgi:hypothetical protein
MIKTTGVGYTLNIVALDSNGNAVASQTTPPFSVATGKIFKLNFQVFVTSSTGGSVFAPTPKIALVDRGANLVTEGYYQCYYHLYYQQEFRYYYRYFSHIIILILVTVIFIIIIIVAIITEGLKGLKCTAYLSRTPTGTEQLHPPELLETSFELGIATFPSLFINEAGYPYEFSFNTTATGVQVNIHHTALKNISNVKDIDRITFIDIKS